MISARTLKRLVGLLAILVTVGCASAYHRYSDCCVPRGYCPPPPLPFVYYAECGCSSCSDAQHQAEQFVPVEGSVEGEMERAP